MSATVPDPAGRKAPCRKAPCRKAPRRKAFSPVTRRQALASGSAALLAAADHAVALPAPGGVPGPVPLAVPGFEGPGSLRTLGPIGPVGELPARRVDVWLPPDAGQGGQRHPLVVMQDGQNLFEPRHAMGGETWQMPQAALRHAGRTGCAPVIVGVWNSPSRRRDYLPVAMERELDPDIRQRIAAANGGPPLSELYLAFLTGWLIPWARTALPVSSRRRDTVVIGASMGGLIALAALCRDPRLVGGAGCLSIHWPLLTDAAAYERGELETGRVLAALDRFMDRTMLRPGAGHRLFIDRGTEGRDSLYPPYQAAMDARLAGLGWRERTGLRSRVIDGSGHNEAAWRGRIDAALSWLLPA